MQPGRPHGCRQQVNQTIHDLELSCLQSGAVGTNIGRAFMSAGLSKHTCTKEASLCHSSLHFILSRLHIYKVRDPESWMKASGCDA
jgi:hypothetical protein